MQYSLVKWSKQSSSWTWKNCIAGKDIMTAQRFKMEHDRIMTHTPRERLHQVILHIPYRTKQIIGFNVRETRDCQKSPKVRPAFC